MELFFSTSIGQEYNAQLIPFVCAVWNFDTMIGELVLVSEIVRLQKQSTPFPDFGNGLCSPWLLASLRRSLLERCSKMILLLICVNFSFKDELAPEPHVVDLVKVQSKCSFTIYFEFIHLNILIILKQE